MIILALLVIYLWLVRVDMPGKSKWHELEEVGERIREARERLGLTQHDLAERMGKTQKAISSYETAGRAIRLNELPALAQALEVSVGYLFGYEVPEEDANELLLRLASFTPERRHLVMEKLLIELDWWTRHNSTELTNGNSQLSDK